MKTKLNIFSNNKINNFLTKFLFKYELTFLKLEEINYKDESAKANIIIINNDRDYNEINFENLNANYLIFTNLIKRNLNLSNTLQLLNTPKPVNNINNKIEYFFQNLKIYFHDISINNEKVTNLKNNSFLQKQN